MGSTPDTKIESWLDAAGQAGKSGSVRKRVVTAGDFLEKTARMNPKAVCDCLTGMDFSKPVDVVKLPNRIFVQYVKKHAGVWFTDTGLTPDLIGLAGTNRKRTLFRPSGSVPALRSKARSIRDTWTIPAPKDASREDRRKLSTMTRGGGTQYVVFDKSRMRKV